MHKKCARSVTCEKMYIFCRGRKHIDTSASHQLILINANQHLMAGSSLKPSALHLSHQLLPHWFCHTPLHQDSSCAGSLVIKYVRMHRCVSRRRVPHNDVHCHISVICVCRSLVCCVEGELRRVCVGKYDEFKHPYNNHGECFWSESAHFTTETNFAIKFKVLRSSRKNQATQIIVNRIINHQMLWDSAHKHCHGPKQKLDANCFWKMLLLVNKTSLHPSICPLSGTVFLPPRVLTPPVSTVTNWPKVVKVMCKSPSRVKKVTVACW